MRRIIHDPRVQGQFRHLLTALGPVLAMNGVTTDANWQLIVGVVMAMIGFVASYRAPEKK